MPALLRAATQTPSNSGLSYWQVVGAAYFRRFINRLALYFIIGIVVLSVFVPFIANGRPYTVVIDGKRAFPLFASLTKADLIILVVAAAVVVYAIFHWRARRYDEPTRRGSARIKAMIPIFVVALAGTLSIAIFKRDFNDIYDRFDYRDMVAQGQATGAVFAPLTWDYSEQEPLESKALYADPSRDHALGTDGIGRDALARLLWSARIVLGIGLVSEIIALVVGVAYGAVMGYFVGKFDIFGMRFVELVESVPTLFLIITFVALFGRQIFIIMIILGLTGWTGIARFVRAEFLKIRKLDYVTAAVAGGLPLRSILFRHMLPNGMTPVLVTATFGIAGAVTAESSLSFLGLGVEPPTPSWGAMLNEASDPTQTFHFWLAFTPGMMIFLTILAYNIIGEGFRDAIDPRINRMQK